MLIQQKRIRTLARHLSDSLKNKKLRFGVNLNNETMARTRLAGFSKNTAPGERVLPTIVGPVTRFNSRGKEIPQKDQPMETAQRMIWHKWIERHGDKEVENEDFRFASYPRYPRRVIDPPGIELSIFESTSGNKVIVTDPIQYSGNNEATILQSINVVLELYQQCIVFDEQNKEVIKVPVTRLNWQVLPPGEYPWEVVSQRLQSVIEKAKQGNRPVIRARLNLVNSFNPDFCAIGNAGFNGYVIFGFSKKNLYILESCLYGNAIYAFKKNWEQLSQMTKAEILSQNLQLERIVHRHGWDEKLRRLLK